MVNVEQVVGAPPGWFTLGAPLSIEVDGVQTRVREVLGDWSDRHPCDLPPRYVHEDFSTRGVGGWDLSPDRLPIRCPFLGKPISDLANTHSGSVAILFNGPSLKDHDLHKITGPIIGMNRTHAGWPGYDGPQPDYLCVIDCIWFDHPKWRRSLLTHPRIINGSVHQADIGYRVARHPRMGPFSFDLHRDGYSGPVPCTTGYLALQLAVYLGFTEINCLGLDMTGGHFDGTKASLRYPMARAHMDRIAERVREVRPDVQIRIVNSDLHPSSVTCLPHVTFSEVFGG